MIKPNWPLALQTYLQADPVISALCKRIAFLKAEVGDGPHIVFNEWTWSERRNGNITYEKGIDIFPVLIDVVVPYDQYMSGYDIRHEIRKKLGAFNGQLNQHRSWSIAFKQHLAPDYNPQTKMITFGCIYLLKQNYDYTH